MNGLFALLVLAGLVCLPWALFNPSRFSRILGPGATKKKAGMVFGGGLLASFILFVATSPQPIRTPVVPSPEASAVTSSVPTPLPSASTAPDGSLSGPYPVTEIVDGDTIKVAIDGQSKTLRVIGMDTPEIKDPRSVVECFGQEASNKANELLRGKSVYLEADATQGELDKYGRTLRYVFFDDGGQRRNFAQLMISEGYAFEYTYQTPYKYQADFKAAQNGAQSGTKGLWSPQTCNGLRQALKPSSQVNSSPNPASSPVATANSAATAAIQANTPNPTKEVESQPKGGNAGTGAYGCAKKKCTEVASCEEAYYQLKTCGNTSLDRDKDGVPCEDKCS